MGAYESSALDKEARHNEGFDETGLADDNPGLPKHSYAGIMAPDLREPLLLQTVMSRRSVRKDDAQDVSDEEASGLSDYYVWKTAGDGNVRDSHAELDGEVFHRDEPPSIGHPGEEYNCRCVAEFIPKSELARYAKSSDNQRLKDDVAAERHEKPDDEDRIIDRRQAIQRELNRQKAKKDADRQKSLRAKRDKQQRTPNNKPSPDGEIDGLGATAAASAAALAAGKGANATASAAAKAAGRFGAAGAGAALGGFAAGFQPWNKQSVVEPLSDGRRLQSAPGDLYGREQIFNNETGSWEDTGQQIYLGSPYTSGSKPSAAARDMAPDTPELPGFNPEPADQNDNQEGFDQSDETGFTIETFPIDDQNKVKLEGFPDLDEETQRLGLILESRGNADTQEKNRLLTDGVLRELEDRGLNPRHVAGAESKQQGRLDEQLYKGPGGGKRGGTRADIGIEVTDPSRPDEKVRLDINTVDTRRDGQTPTSREQHAADLMGPNRERALSATTGHGQRPNLLTRGQTELVPKSGGDSPQDWYERVGKGHAERIADTIEKLLNSSRR